MKFKRWKDTKYFFIKLIQAREKERLRLCSITYSKWLREQSDELIIDTLGEFKGKLFIGDCYE